MTRVGEPRRSSDYADPAFAAPRLCCAAARGRAHAEQVIAAFDVRCAGPGRRDRGLLSGGNMQKLILGRALGARAARCILADQPTWGLDVGAVADVHGRCSTPAPRGAGVLLISEDLDEILALADRIAVMHRGRLSPARCRPSS